MIKWVTDKSGEPIGHHWIKYHQQFDHIAARYFAKDPRKGILCQKARALCFYPECKKARRRAWVCGRRERGDPY